MARKHAGAPPGALTDGVRLGDTVEVVRWDKVGRTWGARSAAASFAMFVSTNDVSADAPTDANKKDGDVWKKRIA